MCGEIHCKRNEQDNHKQRKQRRVNADCDFTAHDFPKNPHAQPNESCQQYQATDYENAIHYGSPDLSADILPQSVDIPQNGKEH